MIFAQQPALWIDSAGRIQTRVIAPTDKVSEVKHLLPGDYFAIAAEGLQVEDAKDPELLQALAAHATHVTLQEGMTHNLELSVVSLRAFQY